MSTTERMAQFAAGLRFEALPKRVVRIARRQVMGLVGAAFAGMRTGGVQAIARAIGIPGAGAADTLAGARATAFPLLARTSLEDALYLNACASIAHDMDDYLVFGHTGHSAVFASLGAGESLRRSGKEVLTAVALANELGGRLGASSLIGPQNGQLWSYIHQLGGAAAVAKLLGLDARATRHALSLALAQPTFGLWPGFMGPDSKLTTAADPLRTGVRAAFLAAQGLTGAAEILDGPKGFFGCIPFVALPSFFTGLGSAWVTETVAVEETPGCAYLTSAVVAACDALAKLKKERGHPLSPDDLDRIVVRATLLTVEMDNLSKPYVLACQQEGKDAAVLSSVIVNFSTPLSIAVAVLDGGVLAPEGLSEERLARDQATILSLARRIRVEHDGARSAELVRECDRVLDIPGLIEGIPLSDLARGVSSQRSMHPGHGAGIVGSALAAARQLGSTGRTWARRMLEERASSAIGKVGGFLQRAFKEVIPPGGDQSTGVSAPEPAAPSYDLGHCGIGGWKCLFGAEVEIHARDGSSARSSCEIPPGAPGRTDDENDELAQRKLKRYAEPVLGEARTRGLLEVLLGLEDAPDLSRLSSVLEGAALRG